MAQLPLRGADEKVAFLAQLQNAVHIGIAVTDEHGTFLHLNRGWSEVTGRAAPELLGHSVVEVLADEYRPRVVQRLLSRADELEPPEEWLVRRPDGSPRWVSAMCRPLTLNDHRQLRLLTFFDITEQKQLEQEQRRLERLSRQQEKRESLVVFAGGLAHRFNNLLTSILGYADLARSLVEPGSPVAPMLDEVIAASRQAASLVQQVLAFSGKGQFIYEVVNLSELVRQMLPGLRELLPKKALLLTDLAEDLPAVEGDANQLRQLLNSLVSNAGDALLRQEGTVTIRTRTALADALPREPSAGAADAVYVSLEVEDNGVGIPTEVLPRIFDPFYSTKFPGRGMGLAAAFGIVQGHRGHFQVNSELGKGSRFQVLLPAATAAAPVEDLPPQGQPS